MHRLIVGLSLFLTLLLPDLVAAQPSAGPVIRTANLQLAATATGNGTALDASQAAVAVLQTSGTFSGTVTYEASLDGSTWSALTCYTISGSSGVTTATAAAAVRCNVAGWLQIRARVSAYTSGSITVKGVATSLAMPFAATSN